MGSVIRHSPILSSLDATEHSIAQAISAHGSGFVEVRMAVTTRYGAVHGHDHSLYHVRRKDWATVKDLELGYWTENDWNTRTIYVVSTFCVAITGALLIGIHAGKHSAPA